MKKIRRYITLDRIVLFGVICFLLYWNIERDKTDYKSEKEKLEQRVKESEEREKKLLDRIDLRADSIKVFKEREDSFNKLIINKDVKINDLKKRKHEKADIIINDYTGDDLVEFFSNIVIPEDRHN